MNAKIERVNKDIEKTKEKINEFQARLRDFEKQKTELENLEIVDAVRGVSISFDELAELLKAARAGAITSGHNGPKTKKKTPKPTDDLIDNGDGDNENNKEDGSE